MFGKTYIVRNGDGSLAESSSVGTRRFIGPVLGALVASFFLVQAVAFGSASSTSSKQASEVDLTIVFTSVAKTRATGSALFTATTDNGSRLKASGVVSLAGRRTASGFRTSGTGTITFSGTGRRTDGSTVRISKGRGTLTFLGGTSDGTGMVINDATLKFLGGATEGTGI